MTIRTSLPEVYYNENDIKNSFFAFESFEMAKKAFRDKIKEFAFSENNIFDGEGRIKEFNSYIEKQTK